MREARRFWAVFLLAAAGFAAITHRVAFSAGNDASRFAQIEAIVDFGRPTIEGTTFAWTIDRVEVGDRIYSNKPPFLSLVGALVYAPIEATTGWSLGDPATRGRAIWLLTWILVGVPAAALVALFDRELQRFEGLSASWRTAVTLALGAGTLVTSFAGTLNNHVPAAALLFAGFTTALAGRAGRSGVAAGLAGAIDLLPGFGMAPFLGWIATRGTDDEAGARRRLGRFSLGVCGGLLATLASNLFVTGTLLAPKWLPGSRDVSASLGPSVGGVLLPVGKLYPLEILFGPHGFFLVSPVLFVGAVGLVLSIRQPPFGHRSSWIALAVGLVAQYAGHAALAGSYGGWSYGYRYLLPIQPLVLYTAPVALAYPFRRRLFASALPVSVLFAGIGAYHPWIPAYDAAKEVHPIAKIVRNPVGASAAAICYERLDRAPPCRWLINTFISPHDGLSRRYLMLYFGAKSDRATVRRLLR